MADDEGPEVQVWALAAAEVTVPAFAQGGPMSRQRLGELRTVLAALADTPIATLEVHPLPPGVDLSRGIALGSASPLAEALARLIGGAPGSGPVAGGAALYRMVVPAKVAAQLGSGLVQPLLSNSTPSGIHSALANSPGIAGQAAFVQFAAKNAAAALGGMTPVVAGSLIMMALAAGLSARSEMASRRVADVLERMRADTLDDDRNRLESCRNPIEKATAIILDQGTVGHSLGLSEEPGSFRTVRFLVS